MGETGAGITSADQIDMSQSNHFTNRWSTCQFFRRDILTDCFEIVNIKATFPWLWEMKVLIDERPNLIPVGIGNNNSSIDMSDFLETAGTAGIGEEDYSSNGGLAEELDEDVDNDTALKGELSSGGDDFLDKVFEDAMSGGTKRKASTAEKKTGARPGISNPATQRDAKKSKTSMMDRFGEQLKAEEATEQRVLELKKARVEAQSARELAKIKAQADIKKEKLRLRAQLEEKRMEFELKKAQLAQPGPSRAAFGFPESPIMPMTFPSFAGGPRQLPDHLSASNSNATSYVGSPAPSGTYGSLDDGPSTPALDLFPRYNFDDETQR